MRRAAVARSSARIEGERCLGCFRTPPCCSRSSFRSWRAARRLASAIEPERRFVLGRARRSKKSNTFPSMTKTIVGMTTAGMAPAGIGAVMSRTRAPAGAALMAGTAGAAVIPSTAMVAAAQASGIRVLPPVALARAGLRRRRACRPAGLQRPVTFAPAALSHAPAERRRCGLPRSARRRRAFPWR